MLCVINPGLFSSPFAASLDRPKTEMSRAEAAALLEKKHLKECEENDYRILEGLFEARGSIDASVQPYEVSSSSSALLC